LILTSSEGVKFLPTKTGQSLTDRGKTGRAKLKENVIESIQQHMKGQNIGADINQKVFWQMLPYWEHPTKKAVQNVK
jgi:hypothetical protein